MAQKMLALRMASITIKNLDVLVRDLVMELENEMEKPSSGYTFEDLRNYFARNEIFPPETYFDRNIFSTEKPKVTLTYLCRGTPIVTCVETLMRRFAVDDTVYVDIFLSDLRTPVSVQDSLSNSAIRCVNVLRFSVFAHLNKLQLAYDHFADTWNHRTT